MPGFIKTEYAIVNIKHKTIDLLKNHICSKTKLFVNRHVKMI